MTGYVYLLHCQNRYKIGIAGDVAKRLSGIQTSNPFPVELIASTKVESPRDLETELHTAYSHRRVLREWFELTPDEVGAVLTLFQDRHRPNIEAEIKEREAAKRKAVKREPRAIPEPKVAPSITPMPECYWIANRRQNRTKYMLSKQDGLDLFCSYLASSKTEFLFSGLGRNVKIRGFKDENLLINAVKYLEPAEFCVRVGFEDEAFSVVIYRAHAFLNDKGQIYFKPCTPAVEVPDVEPAPVS